MQLIDEEEEWMDFNIDREDNRAIEYHYDYLEFLHLIMMVVQKII